MKAVTIQNDQWYLNNELSDLIGVLQQVNFSSRASRNIGIAQLDSLVSVHPYRITGSSAQATGDIRFSFQGNGASPIAAVNIAYIVVNASRNGWAMALQQIRSALNYADRNNEKTMLTDGSANEQTESVNAPDPELVRSQYNDASQSFRFGVASLNQLMKAGTGTYNVLTFEKEMGLEWSTSTQSPIASVFSILALENEASAQNQD